MTKKELVEAIANYDDDTHIVIMTHKDGDDYQDFEIDAVHDLFHSLDDKMISIECNITNLK